MLLKDFPDEVEFTFDKHTNKPRLIYFKQNNKLWCRGNEHFRQKEWCVVSVDSYLEWEITIYDRLNIIEALQAMAQGKLIRGIDWEKDHYIYAKDNNIYDEKNDRVYIDKIASLTKQDMELYIEKELEVKLNDEYVAKITKSGVKVGCQTFTTQAIEDLYKAIKEINN